MDPPRPARLTVLGRLGCLLSAALLIRGYHTVGTRYYEAYWIPQGAGMGFPLPHELAHWALFVVFGVGAGALLVLAMDGVRVSDRDLVLLRRAVDRPWPVAIAAGAVALAGGALVGQLVLEHAAIVDDEHTYRFIAQTLRTGAVTAPSPGRDLAFFREQFVVLTEQERYGKYPIGHPLLLAAGQLLGLETWVVPLLTGLTALPLLVLGLRVTGPPTAVLGVLLWALSPQVLLTGGTLLSQPASALFLVTGLAALLAAESRPRPGPLLIAAGAAFGAGILVRPLPGVLFAGAAGLYVIATHRPPARVRPAVTAGLAFGVPVAALVGLFLLVNRAQSGRALISGYHALHTPGGGALGLFTVSEFPTEAISLVAGVLRLNLWLLGWPVSLAFCGLAHRSRRTGLLWAMVAMAMLYRLVSPKAGVASTGPQYLYEVVPLLALLTADGIGRLATGGWLGREPRVALRRAAALVLAGTVVSATMFLPVALRNLRRAAEAQLILPRIVATRKLANAVVFHEYAVSPNFLTSWASFPRHNAPALDDDVLFVRFLPPPVPPEDHLRFWREHFPGRTAWYFGYPDGRPRLVPLEVYVRSRVLQQAADRDAPGTVTPAPGDGPLRR